MSAPRWLVTSSLGASVPRLSHHTDVLALALDAVPPDADPSEVATRLAAQFPDLEGLAALLAATEEQIAAAELPERALAPFAPIVAKVRASPVLSQAITLAFPHLPPLPLEDDTEAGRLRLAGDRHVGAGELAEAEAVYLRALEVSRDRREEVRIYEELGELYLSMGRVAEAEAAYQIALAGYREVGGRAEEAMALLDLGNVLNLLDRLDEASKVCEEALTIFRAGEDRAGEATALVMLGDILREQNRLPEAAAALTAARDIARAEARSGLEALAEVSLGATYRRNYSFDAAETSCSRALALFHQDGDARGVAQAQTALGALYAQRGQLVEAEAAYREALSGWESLHHRRGEANTRMLLGELYLEANRLTEAEPHFSVALKILRDSGSRSGEAGALRDIGDLHLRAGRLAEAEATLDRAKLAYLGLGDQLGQAMTESVMADLLRVAGRLSEAEASFTRVLGLYRSVGEQLGEANTTLELGSLALSQHKPHLAFLQLRTALHQHEAIGNPRGVNACLGYLTRAAIAAGDPRRGLVLAHRAREGFRKMEDRHGELLVLLDTLLAWQSLADHQGYVATVVLTTLLARELDNANAEPLLAHLHELLPAANLDDPKLRSEADAIVSTTLAALAYTFKQEGIDPLSDLEGADPIGRPPGA